jgi:hypothetical protein
MKNPVKTTPTHSLPGGNAAATGELVEACASLPRRYYLASRYWLPPACQGIASGRAGTSLYLLGKESFLAKQVKACTSLPRSCPSTSRYQLAPACQVIAPWRAGPSLYQLSNDLFLGEPVQDTYRGKRRRPLLDTTSINISCNQ